MQFMCFICLASNRQQLRLFLPLGPKIKLVLFVLHPVFFMYPWAKLYICWLAREDYIVERCSWSLNLSYYKILHNSFHQSFWVECTSGKFSQLIQPKPYFNINFIFLRQLQPLLEKCPYCAGKQLQGSKFRDLIHPAIVLRGFLHCQETSVRCALIPVLQCCRKKDIEEQVPAGGGTPPKRTINWLRVRKMKYINIYCPSS